MTQNNKYIPEGYKDSPLGVIPQEWEVKRLGDICKTFSGGTPKSTESRFYDGNIPFIKSGEINDNRTEQFLSDDGYKKSSAKMVAQGDILYALYGANSGECAISQIHGAINQAILCIRTNIDSYFLLSVLQKNKDFYIRNYLQGGQGNLSGEIVKSYSIAVPPLAEQRRIAEVLGCWDEAIERQERMVSLLTTRKRALMQRLLTPQPHWQKTKLSKYIKEYKEKPQLGVEYEVYTSSKNGLMKQTDYYGDNRITNRIDVDYNVIPSGFITYRSRSDDGLFTFNKNKSSKGLVSGYYPVFTISIGNTDFILEYLNYFKVKLTKYSIGTSQLVLSFSALYNAKFELPDETEQKAIAEKLSTADAEIDLARHRLDLLRTQKRALMQQLLTGKKQLKIK